MKISSISQEKYISLVDSLFHKLTHSPYPPISPSPHPPISPSISKEIYYLFIALIFTISITTTTNAQTTFEHISNQAIYDLIDELANNGIIEVNTTIKPYSRKYIYEKLDKAEKSEKINKRQKKEIEFYLKEYSIETNSPENPYKNSKLNLIRKRSDNSALQLDQLGYFYKDSNFTFSVKPIWGINYRTNSTGSVRHFWGGLEANANIGKHWGLYASLRDNSITEIMAFSTYFTQDLGGNYKIGEGGRPGGDFSEMRGGITYSWKWGDVGLIKDHLQWGDNYHGANILSGRTPSYAMVKFHANPVKWFDFNYHHGWLVSEDIDSALSYISTAGSYRAVFRQKFIASNMFTFIPFKGINFSLGNSIIYSDLGGPHPAYFIPVMFFKSIDHTLNHGIENQNSQMFCNLSIRKIKHLHVFGTLYIDEFKKERVGNDTLHNFVSYKFGAKLSNWPIQNLSGTFEFTQTNPMTYQHTVESTTFESNRFNLGHYLRDNSREVYFALEYKPIARLRAKLEYFYAVHGKDIKYNNNSGFSVVSVPILHGKTWDNKTYTITAEYEVLSNVYFKLLYQMSNIQGYQVDGKTAQEYLDKFTPAFYHGKQSTVGFGFNIGF